MNFNSFLSLTHRKDSDPTSTISQGLWCVSTSSPDTVMITLKRYRFGRKFSKSEKNYFSSMLLFLWHMCCLYTKRKKKERKKRRDKEGKKRKMGKRRKKKEKLNSQITYDLISAPYLKGWSYITRWNIIYFIPGRNTFISYPTSKLLLTGSC